RRIWERFGGDAQQWQRGHKVAALDLPGSGKRLVIVKDLSELSSGDKRALFPDLAAAVGGGKVDTVFLLAANDGQLIASWRDWAEPQGGQHLEDFKVLEEMLVEE